MIRLTITLERDPERIHQWTSHCLELDVISAGLSPEHALKAAAEAVRVTIQDARRHGLTSEEAFSVIAAEVAARPPQDRP